MGLFDKLFGLSLVIAGITIGIYFTLWTLMILVRQFVALTLSIAFCLKQSPRMFARSFHRSGLVIQITRSCSPRWSLLHILLAQEDLGQDCRS